MKNNPHSEAGRGDATSGHLDARNDSAPGLYVHVPFCKTKCPYCDFYSVTSGASVAEWLEAVAREAARFRGVFGTFDTLYIGGGTPSLLGETEMHGLVDALTETFEFFPDAEITIEANPDDVTPHGLANWRALGVNRVSLGVQSFDDAELRFLRRRHDAAQARGAIELLHAGGVANVGLDLICGFAGQSIESWERSMRRAVELSPEHLSCYQMTIEPETEFGRMLAAGSLEIPGEETQRSFFLRTSRFLRSNGYIHYEISNFARAEDLVSRHNHKYWRHAPYLGLGPAAHSFRDGKRWWNLRSVEKYCRALAGRESSVEDSETLSDDERAFEALYLGFRTREGVAVETLRRYPDWRRTLDALVAESLVVVENGRALPTVEGFCVADRLATAFAR